MNQTYTYPKRPTMKAASTVKKLLGNPDADAFDRICDDIQNCDAYRISCRYPEFFGCKSKEDIPNRSMLEYTNDKQYDAFRLKKAALVETLRAAYPELVQRDKEAKWSKQIIGHMFQDAERMKEAIIPTNSNWGFDQHPDRPMQDKGHLLERFARDHAPKLTYEQLSAYDSKKIVLGSHKYDETISAYNRTSSSSVSLEGTIELDKVYPISTWYSLGVNRI